MDFDASCDLDGIGARNDWRIVGGRLALGPHGPPPTIVACRLFWLLMSRRLGFNGSINGHAESDAVTGFIRNHSCHVSFPAHPYSSHLPLHSPTRFHPMAFDQEDRSRDPLKHDRQPQPMFTSSRHDSLQQPPEFFTESLNTEHVPTANLHRASARDGRRAKPRRVLGTPRGLAASFKATADNQHHHFPISSAWSEEGRRPISPLLSHVSIAGAETSFPTTTSPSARRPQTPSPNRGRQASSASSPPDELVEAYQRITDEESLAQEESVEDDMGTLMSDYTDLRRSQDGQTGSQQLHNLDSMSPLYQSRKQSPRGYQEHIAPDAREREEDHRVAGEESSNLIRETATDGSPIKQSSQFTKDMQRIQGVLNSGARAFRKGRVGRKVGLTVENLRSRNGSNDSVGSTMGDSVSSKGSDPSSNIPRDWGRKARPGSDWLNRINGKSGKHTGEVSHRRRASTQTIPEHRDVEPLHEWVKTAPEEARLQAEDHSLSSTSSAPTPSMQNISRERMADWEINSDDFTGRSLQISDSPPMRFRTNVLNRDVDREIDDVAKKAVTTNRLDQLRERTSDERSRQRLRTRSEENLSHQAVDTPQRIPPRRSSLKFKLEPTRGEDSEQLSKSTGALGDDGDPIPDSPVVIYPGTPANMEKGAEAGTSRRANHGNRHDSLDLLRQLSRATSESPSSAKEEPASISNDGNRNSSTPSEKNPLTETQKDAELAKKRREEDMYLMKKTTKKEDTNADNHAPRRAETDQVVQQTPQIAKSKLDMKTPVVTGAWIDTPVPNMGRGPLLATPANLDDERENEMKPGNNTRKVAATDVMGSLNPNILSKPEQKHEQSREPLKNTGPTNPKSALESIITAAKSHSKSGSRKTLKADSDEDPTLLLGDSTIQSLEEILEKDDTKTSEPPRPSPQPSSAVQSDDEADADDDDDEDHAKTSKSSLSTVQSQISRLDNVGPSIRDAKRRLAYLERVVSQSQSRLSQREREREPQCDEGGEIHDFVWPCERCGYSSSSNIFSNSSSSSAAAYNVRADGPDTISITMPKLWRWRGGDWRPRLTWLGVGLLMWWGYLIADKIAW